MNKNTINMKDKKNDAMDRKFVTFAALNPYIEDNIVKPIEKEVHGQNWISWGEQNTYPNYLYSLYEGSTTLRTLINACTDYVAGDAVHSVIPYLNDAEATKLVKNMGFQILMHGGCFLNVLRNKLGQVCKVVPLDFRKVRSSKDGDWFYYSDDFAVKSYGRGKYVGYPAFNSDAKNIATSIYYYKNSYFSVYGEPDYASATIACEVERKIAEYHLNNLNNNFSSNYIVTFCNGIPTDEIREEIEEMINDKYAGVENSGRPVISFAPDKDHAVQIEKLDTEDWGKKYESLRDDCRQQIFTAFRCAPTLLGILDQTTGFNEQEYAGAFKVFNRNYILPIQKEVCSILDSIFGQEDSITIEPYSIDFERDGADVEEITTTETKEEE